MNNATGMARRYHWHSEKVNYFVETPHTFIYVQNQGAILNLVDREVIIAKAKILDVIKECPSSILSAI